MRNPTSQPSEATGNDPKAQRRLRWGLLLLVLVLSFEGLARKLSIANSSIAIFLLKDVIIAAMSVQVLMLKRSSPIQFLWAAYIVEALLFLPVIISTAAHDPILAIFGAKQYLLYPMVAFAVFMGFENSSSQEIVRFFRWMALLIIPTTAVALIQLRLPASHWLNLSVDGGDLEGFAAAGHLRVSSTFSFVAQYCAFINAEVFITMIALNNMKDIGWFKKLIYLSIVPLLIISSYVTGSRGAVLVNLVIVAVAVVLSLMKFQARSALRIIIIVGALLLTLATTQYLFPDAFAAYSEREQGQLIGASTEIQDRISDSLFNWTRSISSTPFFGYGLGIMSNGSEMVSSYAFTARAYSWTETDFATTLFEGGIYLMVVWYGFRFFVIYQTLRRFLSMRGDELALPGAFCIGFIAIIGFNGTLAIQPPIAIWWWIAVGISIVIWWKSMEAKKNQSDGISSSTHLAAPSKNTGPERLRRAPPPEIGGATSIAERGFRASMIFIFDSHPVQYKAPVYQRLQQIRPDSFQVFYASDATMRGHRDQGFATKIIWDTPLLDGYRYRVFHNERGTPFQGFRSLTGRGVFALLRKERPAAVLISQFLYAFDFVTYLSSLFLHIPVWIRHETQDEAFARPPWKAALRNIFYRLAYAGISHAFYIGALNREHLLRHGITGKRLSRAPYCTPVRAIVETGMQSKWRSHLRERLGVEQDETLLLFSGKFIEKKNPALILEALRLLSPDERSRFHLVFVGPDRWKKNCVRKARCFPVVSTSQASSTNPRFHSTTPRPIFSFFLRGAPEKHGASS